MIKSAKRFLIALLESLFPLESLTQSKKKWNRLGRSAPRYVVWTTMGRNITEGDLDLSGQRDYLHYVANDHHIQTALGDLLRCSVLEVGCGIGRVTRYLGEAFQSVDALDISDELIRVGKERLGNQPNVHLVATDGRTFPFSDGAYDLVFSYLVFQHMPDFTTVKDNLSEVARVLKSTGIAKIQLRGVPIRRFKWSYGVSFDRASAHEVIRQSGLTVLHEEGAGQKNYWVWLKRA